MWPWQRFLPCSVSVPIFGRSWVPGLMLLNVGREIALPVNHILDEMVYVFEGYTHIALQRGMALHPPSLGGGFL